AASAALDAENAAREAAQRFDSGLEAAGMGRRVGVGDTEDAVLASQREGTRPPGYRSGEIPTTRDDTPRTPGLNSAVPFDPASAAVGAGAGLDEDGEMDPWRTGAGMLFAGVAGKKLKAAELAIPPKRLKELTSEQVASHAANSGSTFNPRLGNLAGKPLYSVALYPERGLVLDAAPTPEILEKFIKANRVLLADERLSVGTWHNAADGKHYLDIVATLPDRALAERLGRSYNQIAIYGLESFEEVGTGGTGTVPRRMPPIDQRLPLAGDASAEARGELAAQAERIGAGERPDWWQREFGADPNRMAQANKLEAGLERAMDESAAKNGGLADLSSEELKQFATPTTKFPTDVIPNPTPLSHLREIVDFALGRGYGNWYREFSDDLTATVGKKRAWEAHSLFISFSAVLDPETAKKFTLATMLAADQHNAFQGMDAGQIAKIVIDKYKEVVQTDKGLYYMPVHFSNVASIYGTGERAIGAPKLSNFWNDFFNGRLPWQSDAHPTNDVHMQRLEGYRAWGEEGGKLGNDENTYRYGSAVTRRIASELGVPPEDAQAAGWVVQQMSSLPTNVNAFAKARRINLADPEKAEIWKAAEEPWKALAKGVRDGTIGPLDAMRELQRIGAFDLHNPGSLKAINDEPSIQKLTAAFQQGGFANKPMPGARPRGEGQTPAPGLRGAMSYTPVSDRPWMSADIRARAENPLNQRMLEQAPSVAVEGASPPAGLFVRELGVPNRVVDMGSDARAIALPTSNPERAASVARALAERTSQTVTVRRAAQPGEAPTHIQVTIDAANTSGLPKVVEQIRDEARALGLDVHWNGQQAHFYLDASDMSVAKARVSDIYDMVQSKGINGRALRLGGSRVEQFGPGGAAAPGVVPRGEAAATATSWRSAADDQLAERIARVIGGDGSARGRGGSGAVPDGRPDGGVRAGGSPQGVPGLNSALPFDPTSAAMGGYAGSQVEGEDGEAGDPLRTLAGMGVAGIMGRKFPGMQRALDASQRRAAALAARGVKPLNPLQWAGEAVKTAGYSSMIGIRTATVNMAGNLFEPIWGAPKEVARAGARAVERKNLAALREPGEMFYGALSGLAESGGEMLQALMARGRYASNPDQPRLSERTINPVGHAVASGLEFGGRVFSGLPDAFFGTIARRAGERRTAAQIATDAGLKGDAWKARVAEILADRDEIDAYMRARASLAGQTSSNALMPGQPPAMLDPDRMAAVEKMVKDGAAHADDMTYRNKLGTWGEGFKKFATFGNTPVIGTLSAPFVTTPWNARTRMLEKTPIGFGMNVYNRPGTARTRFDKWYDAAVGTPLLIGLAMGPAAAGRVTGSGPSDPNERKTMEENGWKPYSTLVPAADGNEYYVPNRNIGNWGLALNVIGEIHDEMAYRKPGQTPRDQVESVARRIGRIMQDDVYAGGLVDLVGLLTEPDQTGMGWVAQQAARLTPYAASARDISTAMDPNERERPEQGDTWAGMGTELLQRWQQATGQRGGLDPKTDAKGEPMPNEQAGWRAFAPRATQAKNDPIIKEILANDAQLGKTREAFTVTATGSDAPDGGIGTGKVKLTRMEQARWKRHRWEYIQNVYAELMADQEFQRAPESIKQKVWRGQMASAGKYADGMIKEDWGDAEYERRVNEAFGNLRERAS
ncbi:MAG: hypothetical protein IT337_15720, partial [Thermomicrobiales bacterium]|nr:hypothetical protein [Thermomicrobiales bacterium]